MKNHKYYIAYCFGEEETNNIGYGEIFLRLTKKQKIEDEVDIDIIKKYIKEKTFENDGKNIKNIVIMNFIELKGE